MNIGNAAIELLPSEKNSTEAAEVYQNLQILYGTQAGELALDREFGIDANLIDCPQENARALLAAEYVRKTVRYEPRAKVLRLEWMEEPSQDGAMRPKVVVELV